MVRILCLSIFIYIYLYIYISICIFKYINITFTIHPRGTMGKIRRKKPHWNAKLTISHRTHHGLHDHISTKHLCKTIQDYTKASQNFQVFEIPLLSFSSVLLNVLHFSEKIFRTASTAKMFSFTVSRVSHIFAWCWFNPLVWGWGGEGGVGMRHLNVTRIA